MLMFTLVGALYVIELVNMALPFNLDEVGGIVPRQVSRLDGILFAPLLHLGFTHLMSNTVPLLVLGWLVLAGGVREFVVVTVVVWVTSGAGTWLIGSEAVHVGASGVAFGWMTFLLVRGFFTHSFGQTAVAAVLFFCWGGMLWGMLPGQPGISWEGHLFGALGGLIAASAVARAPRARAVREPGPPETGPPGRIAA